MPLVVPRPEPPGGLARAAGLVAFALFFAVSCGSSDGTGEAVTSTIPKSGETGVDPRTIVAIHLSDIMTTEDDNLDPDLIRVTGDLTDGEYQGTISVAKWSSDILPGMTIEEFSPTSVTPGEDEQAPELDALVFLLAGGESFKEGETISVKVSKDVSARGRSLNSSKTFTFVIRESGMETEALRVTGTDPRPAARGVSLSSLVKATFNRDDELTGLGDGLTLRGEQSGVHLNVDSLFTHAAGFDAEITQRLASGDSFLPGEVVEATWNRQLEDADGTALFPYLVRFQVESGLVNGGWDPTLASTDALFDQPVKVLTADFLPESDGVEFLVVAASSLELYRQSQENVWTSSSVDIAVRGGMAVVDAGLIDLDRDGIYEIVVLLANDFAGRLVTFELDDGGNLTQQPDEADVLAGGATGFSVADLDASGDPELLVLHPRDSALGSVTVFQRTEFPPDPDAIDPLDPSTLMPRPGLEAVENPMPSFKEATRVEAVDLTGDGRPDLLAQNVAGGLTIYRNIGGSSAPFAFRLEMDLRGRDGGALDALAWTVADVDSDFDTDLVVWDSTGAILYRNKQATISGLTVQGSDLPSGDAGPEPFPSLDLSLSGPSLVRALELDGDPFLDFVVARPSGAITILFGETQDGTSFEQIAVDGVGGLPVNLAIADVSGDSGQDLVLLESDSTLPVLHLSQNVDAPARPAPHDFRIVIEPRVEEDESLLFVRAEGDIKEVFSGYSLALDYDESVLTYERFEAPEGFGSSATFTTCPDESGDGCEGGVSVLMSYDGRSALPRDGLALGWFVFRLPTVTEDVATELQLETFEDGGTTFENTVSVMESGATFEVLATLPPGPLTVVIHSPAPDDLVASCAVVERRASDMDVQVSWESPAGRAFTEFAIFAGGSQVMIASGAATDVQFMTTLTGVVNLEVQGRTDGEVFSAFCDVIGVHEPEVHCEVVTAVENRITWSLSHSADSFRIYRNGQIINTVVGTVREFRDLSPGPDGSDLYEVDAVVSGMSGPRGACVEGPIGDPDTGFTLPPRNLSAALKAKNSSNDPNEIRASWENGEGYTSLFVALRRAAEGAPSPEDEVEINGTSTEFVFSGDPDLGGVAPNEYIVSIRGVVGGMSSSTEDSSVVTVAVPALATRLACSVVDDGDILMTWDRVWQGYTDLQASIEHRIDDVLQDAFVESIGLESTEFVYTPSVPLGTYRVELAASYVDPLLPPGLQPRPELMRRPCEVVDFDTRVLLGGTDIDGTRRIETGVGIPRVEIQVRAKVLATLSGFDFAFEYPNFLSIGDPLELEIDHLGAQSTVTVTPIGDDRERVEVSVTGVRILPDQDGDGTADGEVELATLVGGVPADFAWAGEYPINFAQTPMLTFAAAPGEAVSPTEVEAEDGTLLVASSYALAEVAQIPAGSADVIPLTVFGTFPERAPDYRLNSFVLHLKFNTDELEFVETREADQSGSAVADRGAFFLPNSEARERANQTGEVTIPWVGFDLQNLGAGFAFLEPGILLNLATFNFRSKVPADSGSVFSAVEFLHGSGIQNPTEFLAEIEDPEVPEPEQFFGGGVQITSAASELSLLSVDPTTGPLAGGTQAALRGAGFSRLNRDDIAVRLVMGDEPGAVHLPVAPEDIVAITENEILFMVPDSGLRPLVGTPASFTADVFLDIDPDGTLPLLDAYAYEFPRLTGADRDSGQADGFQVMVLQGFGFPQDSRVQFVFAGESIEAAINSVSADGRSLQLTIPDLQGHVGELATIELIVPFLNDLSLRLDNFFSVLDGGPAPALSVLEVIPPVGTICGGYEVTVKGEEFRPSLRVFFGDEEAIGVLIDDASTVRVMVPSVLEGTTSVAVRVVDGAIMDTLDEAFTFEHPAPPFRRGDVNEDGDISVLDVVRLSDILVGTPVDLPANLDSADTNDDSTIDGGDVTKLTAALFGDRLPLPDPFIEPGLDPTPDSLTSCPGTF